MAKASRPKKVRKTTTTTSYSDVNEMAHDVRSVLKSIVNQDGKYTTSEAGVVGKLYGAELTRMKMQVDIHKINTKLSSKQTSAEEILRLS